MTVLRIVANIAATDLTPARAFYGELLGLDLVMDQGWIQTFGTPVHGATGPRTGVQVSVATGGGSGTPVPDLSIEVDALDPVLQRLQTARVPIVYGPAHEPWGVRRVFVRDPFGRLLNILQHA